MIRNFLRTCLLSAAALGSVAQAYLLIDDYQTGPYSKTFNGVGQEFHQVMGLDTDHCALGDRTTYFQVGKNPNHVPVTMAIGGGAARVFTPPSQNTGIDSVFETELGLSFQYVLDLSQDKELWVDLNVSKPDGRFANLWYLFISDTHGVNGMNTGWLSRPGGIRFTFSSMNPAIDWSSIRSIYFYQEFDSPGYPESYTVTRIYSVSNGIVEVAPNSFSVLTGQRAAGDLSSLSKQDSNYLVVCRFIVPNQQVPPVSVQFDGALPFTASGFWLKAVSSMASAGEYQVTYDLWDWQASHYDDATSATLGTTPVNTEVTPTRGFARYVGPTGEVRARVRIWSAGPSAVFGWCANFDQLVWEATKP